MLSLLFRRNEGVSHKGEHTCWSAWGLFGDWPHMALLSSDLISVDFLDWNLSRSFFCGSQTSVCPFSCQPPHLLDRMPSFRDHSEHCLAHFLLRFTALSWGVSLNRWSRGLTWCLNLCHLFATRASSAKSSSEQLRCNWLERRFAQKS